MEQKPCFKTKVGGQAVMEGIMMKGPKSSCLAVRCPNGEIYTEITEGKDYKWKKIPLVRGVASMIVSMKEGYAYLMKSAEISMEDEEVTKDKFELWVEKHCGELGTKIIMGFASVLGVVLAMLLFMYLPAVIVKFVDGYIALGATKSLFEGLIKIIIFIAYLSAVSQMNDIKRVFQYHGAEHKTIACYEAGEELTVENARKHVRFHPRCGTSFLFIVILIGIGVASFLPWGNTLVRTALKILLLPIVMGISYELIQFCGRHDNLLTRIISAPGLWVQRLTTKEPDDSMLEVAIAAVKPVLPETPEDATW